MPISKETYHPFSISADGILGHDLRMLLKQIACCIATK